MTGPTDAHLAAALAAERADPWPPGTYWWLSFASTTAFLGVAVVGPAVGPVHAVALSHHVGANPGGEVALLPLPGATPPAAYRDRLLDRATARALDELLAAAIEEEP